MMLGKIFGLGGSTKDANDA